LKEYKIIRIEKQNAYYDIADLYFIVKRRKKFIIRWWSVVKEITYNKGYKQIEPLRFTNAMDARNWIQLDASNKKRNHWYINELEIIKINNKK
tara:strand:- start:127 stop:405 length:279 start_codon:yes stop_codon:yes gene_type:complete